MNLNEQNAHAPSEAASKPARPFSSLDRGGKNGWLARLGLGAGVAALLFLYWFMAVTAAALQSPTFDEDEHLTGGAYIWKYADYHLDAESGVLPDRLAAWPLRGLPLRLPAPGGEEWKRREFAAFCFPFFYRLGNPLPEMLWRAHAAMALLGVAAGLSIFLISRRLWGTAGGFLSLILFVFEPNMLAHGPLVTADMAAALFFTLSAWTFWNLMQRVSPASALAAGAAFGGLLLSKMSAPLFLFMALPMVCLRLGVRTPLPVWGRKVPVKSLAGQAAAFALGGAGMAAVIWGMIWAAYGFRYSINPSELPVKLDFDELLSQGGAVAASLRFFRAWRLLPEGWLYGATSTVLRLVSGRVCFLAGNCGITGFRLFFPLAFAIKSTLPMFLVLGLAVASVWRAARETGASERGDTLRQTGWRVAPLMVLLAVYWTVAIRSQLNIGLRHLFPVYPPTLILAGASARLFDFRKRGNMAPTSNEKAAVRKGRMESILLGALLLWHAAASVWIRPHYLAYFNELIGGPKEGWNYLVDSSLDWGQDLPGIRQWLDAHGENRPERSFISYFGVADLAYYGVRATPIGPLRRTPLAPLTGGVYCISATTLQTTFSNEFGRWSKYSEARYRKWSRMFEGLPPERLADANQDNLREYGDLQLARLYAWMRQREPAEQIHYAILVYRLSDADVQEALHGPPAELAMDDGVVH